MNAQRAFLFDLDGVLVDTAKYHYLAWKRLADGLGFDLTEQDNERLKGVSRRASLEIVLSIGGVEASESEKEEFARKKNDWYCEYLARMKKDEILPNVEPFVRQSIELGVKTAVASASKNARTILDALEIAGLFDVLVDGNATSKAKPDPEVFLLASQGVGVPSADCVVFEDSEAGLEAAVRAGMRSVGIGAPSRLGAADIVVRGFAGLSPQVILEQLKMLKESC